MDIELYSVVTDKERLKEALRKSELLQSERLDLLTYRYYSLEPCLNTIKEMDNQQYSSNFWIVMARDINLLDRCASTLAFMWFSCFIVFAIVSLILAKQTYKTYKNREELEKQRRETTSALAHDLKTPLSIISGYAQNLMENVHTEKKEHYARSIETNVKRMDKIIQDMFELSRLESGSIQIVDEDVQLHKVCANIIDRYERISKEKHIKLSFEGDGVIIADNTLIERVIDNFFVNALNNTTDAGTINIRILKNTLEVYNSGSHIPEEKLKEIWLPYKKLDESRSNTKGTGLGLSISRTILELYKFQYGAKNCNDGVVFWFRFA
jgi:signal transduction histidine kinase